MPLDPEELYPIFLVECAGAEALGFAAFIYFRDADDAKDAGSANDLEGLLETLRVELDDLEDQPITIRLEHWSGEKLTQALEREHDL